MDILSAVLLVGFAARLTRLVAVDDAGHPFRWVTFKLWPNRHIDKAVELLGCPFCIGFWLSALVVASWVLVGHTVAWQLVAGVFTLNYVHAHLNARLDLGADDDDD